jgi:filamentous hemagglutinin family protein
MQVISLTMRCSITATIATTLLLSTSAQAQVSPDGRLSTIVTSPNGQDFTITNGNVAGGNLFHSFSDFSIPTGGSATFDLIGTPNITTIFSRVTGSNISNIDGLMQTANGINPVNLFLLNPNGILFGANARLNLTGSFFGTTADTVRFADNSIFDLNTPAALLTLSVPIGLQMGQTPGAILQRSTTTANGLAPSSSNPPVGLRVNPGQTIGLVGSSVAIEGGRMTAPGGQVEIGSIGANGSVNLAAGGVFSYPTQPMQAIQLDRAAAIDVSGSGGGSVQIQGSQIRMREAASITSNNLGSNNGGQINIIASELLELAGTNPAETAATNITARVRSGATGNGSSINITAPQLNLNGGAQIVSRTDAAGNAGSITIQAQNFAALGESATGNFPSGIISRSEATATGRGGDVSITADTVQMIDGAELRASSRGNGDAGNFSLRAREVTASSTPTTQNYTGISTSSRGGRGRGGDISLEVDRLNILGGAAIRTGTGGAGNAGNLTIRAKAITLRGDDVDGFTAQMFTRAESATTTGNAGNIQIDTDQLNVLDGSVIYTNTAGSGNSGNLLVNARTIEVSGISSVDETPATIQTAVFQQASGQGGLMTLNATDSIKLNTGGQLNSSTLGTGKAGNISLTAPRIEIMGLSPNGKYFSGVSANADSFIDDDTNQIVNTNGNGGVISLNANQVQITDGATIQSITSNSGIAGDINVTADQLVITGSGFFTPQNRDLPSALNVNVAPGVAGQGGRVNLTVGQLQLASGGQVSSSTYGSGKGGDINIQANTIAITGASTNGNLTSGLFGNAAQSTGNSGSIRVNTNQLTITDRGTINVGNFETRFANVPPGQGQAGEVNITAQNLQLSNAGSITTATVNGGGAITIAADQLQLQQNSVIDSSTIGDGNAGKIALTTKSTELTQSTINTNSFGAGNAGQITLIADRATLESASSLSTAATGQGQAGNIVVRSAQINVQDGSQITSRSSGTGNGGVIDLSAQTLRLNQNSALNAQTASGNGGNILLNLSNLLSLNQQSFLSAEAGGTGDGGNISINAPFIVGFNNSDIIANAFQGRGGNIQITTDGLFGLKFRPQLTPDNDITASSQFGVNGSVQIQVLSIDPTQGLAELAIDVIDPNSQIANVCSPDQTGSFVITGQGGVPPNPAYIKHLGTRWQDLRNTVRAAGQTIAPIAQAPPQPILIEATAWQKVANGKVELVAQAPISPRQPQSRHCP